MDRFYCALKDVESKFGIKLKEFQQAVYVKIFAGTDVFLCAPTGSEKTFCFIFLSKLRRYMNQDGDPDPITIIISPLSSRW